HEMPRDFFKHLAVYSILKRREMPRSPIMEEWYRRNAKFGDKSKSEAKSETKTETKEDKRSEPPRPKVIVLEAGIVGSLDYKIISAERADDLFEWLKKNQYTYSGDEATLNFYVQKKWLFTVMKIDTMQMKRNK